MISRTVFKDTINQRLIAENPTSTLKTLQIVVKPKGFFTWREPIHITLGSHTQRFQSLALHEIRFGEPSTLTKKDIYYRRFHIEKSKWGEIKISSSFGALPQLSACIFFQSTKEELLKLLHNIE